jgi:hypothetical protein
MRRHCRPTALGIAILLATGCGSDPGFSQGSPANGSDPEKVRAADVSVLFVGNSHTQGHNLPDLVCRMVRFRHPDQTTYAHVVSVGFLDDVAGDPRGRQEIDTRPWTAVVLQAQRISESGRYDYSRSEGIEVAKLAAARGAAVHFYAEWGLRGKAGHGPRIEAVYEEMARASGGRVAPVGRAWDLALSGRPDLPLYDADGNHQSALGAFLTACVLVGRLTGETPAALAAFPYPGASEADRKYLADSADRALAADGGGGSGQ